MRQRNRAGRVMRIRGLILAALKMVYPSAMPARPLFRSLLAIHPRLEWEDFRQDLSYLREKGYLKQAGSPSHGSVHRPWSTPCLRLSAAGMKAADPLRAGPGGGDAGRPAPCRRPPGADSPVRLFTAKPRPGRP